jgi:hypothetical protein|tara:strand:- start:127 stop:738 length:612 start_codon:yes stop_codon:yes gene_type:complete
LSYEYYEYVNRSRNEEEDDNDGQYYNDDANDQYYDDGEGGHVGGVGEEGDIINGDEGYNGTLMGSDLDDEEEEEEDFEDGRDLEQTVYWDDRGIEHAVQHAGSRQNDEGLASPSPRRVSFAEDVWVKEIPRVDEENLQELFYSEADIDSMYAEAEDEVLAATIPMVVNTANSSAANGGGSILPAEEEDEGNQNQGTQTFNSTI